MHAPECTSPSGICTRGLLHDAGTGKPVAIYEFTVLTMQASGNGAEVDFTGQSVLTKLTGAPGMLFAEDEASFTPDATGPSPFVTRVHVVGGTGSYQDASGTITATGELDTTTEQRPAPTQARSVADRGPWSCSDRSHRRSSFRHLPAS